MAKGIIKRYDFRKGFGFIADDKNGEDFFFHKSEWQGDGPIRKGIAVEFIDKESEKGPQAESVIPLDGDS
ncbi:MAG: cold shock domain-containing protein [Proteobacteria bacterium]|nr:cold shock domain-containing protein [Pseudomonadota bacterium]